MAPQYLGVHCPLSLTQKITMTNKRALGPSGSWLRQAGVNDTPPWVTSLFMAGTVRARRLAGRPHSGLAAEQLRMEQPKAHQQLPVGTRMYHAGKELSIIITGHPSRAVELEPAILAGPHTQQARVDLWVEDKHIVSSQQTRVQRK